MSRILSLFRMDFNTGSNPPPIGELDEIIAACAPEESLEVLFPTAQVYCLSITWSTLIFLLFRFVPVAFSRLATEMT